MNQFVCLFFYYHFWLCYSCCCYNDYDYDSCNSASCPFDNTTPFPVVEPQPGGSCDVAALDYSHHLDHVQLLLDCRLKPASFTAPELINEMSSSL